MIIATSDGGFLAAADDPEVRRRSIRTAEALMRMALPLLDVGGDALTSARLQHSIDAMVGKSASPLTSSEDSPAGPDHDPD